jgi:hypothetical protein
VRLLEQLVVYHARPEAELLTRTRFI